MQSPFPLLHVPGRYPCPLFYYFVKLSRGATKVMRLLSTLDSQLLTRGSGAFGCGGAAL